MVDGQQTDRLTSKASSRQPKATTDLVQQKMSEQRKAMCQKIGPICLFESNV